jgi:DNA-directed RNA polymerase specialized sigma24 family protein
VDEERALARLPETYAAALRLRAQGLGEAAIAEQLGLEREAVDPLLRLAEAKLTLLLETERADIEEALEP